MAITKFEREGVIKDINDARLPSTLGSASQVLAVNSAGTSIVWADQTGSGQSASFTTNKLVFTGGTPTLQGYLLVTSLAGATVTVGSDSYTYGAEETSHNFGPYDYGTYTVKANKTGMYEKSISATVAAATNSCSCIPGRLPSGYTELSYIQSTGTQWISLDITGPLTGYKYESIMQVVTLIASKYVEGNYSVGSYYVYISSGVQYWQASFGSDYVNSLTLVDTNKHTFVFTNNGTTATATIDGTSFWSNNSMKSATGFTICGSSHSNTTACKHFDKKLWKNDELVFCGVPAKRDSDNYIGMYDTVSSTFFENSGTGDFIPGDPV